MKSSKRRRQVRLWDGFLYELRGSKVYGQAHRDRAGMSEVVDPEMAKAARAALQRRKK